MSKTKLLEPTNDVVFQVLFGEIGSERITKKLLENILDKKIESVDLSQNPILRRQTKEDKMGILDVIAKINDGEYVDIEMQMSEHPAIIEEEQRKNILTNKLEFHIIQLRKIKENENMDNELIDWLTFIKNPNSERTVQKMVENRELKEAHEKLETMSEDEEMQRFAEWRQDAIYLENTWKAIEKERGIELGEKIGEDREKIKIAKKLLKIGIKIEDIAESTGLKIDEVKKLINEK